MIKKSFLCMTFNVVRSTGIKKQKAFSITLHALEVQLLKILWVLGEGLHHARHRPHEEISSLGHHREEGQRFGVSRIRVSIFHFRLVQLNTQCLMLNPRHKHLPIENCSLSTTPSEMINMKHLYNN